MAQRLDQANYDRVSGLCTERLPIVYLRGCEWHAIKDLESRHTQTEAERSCCPSF